MLHTLDTVRAAVRVRDGRRVYYLPEGDRLTPGAQDWLREENIRVLPPEQAPQHYTTLWGGTLTEKPEHMTHLRGNVLVPKDHPRIAFRGMIDALEAEILLCQQAAQGHAELQQCLQEMLEFVRRLIRADVLDEPVQELLLCGMDAAALRERSHHPEKYFGQPHFLPAWTDGPALLQLNRLRTLVRQAELSCYRAFSTPEGGVARKDLLLAMNRLSSLCWILIIRIKAGQL